MNWRWFSLADLTTGERLRMFHILRDTTFCQLFGRQGADFGDRDQSDRGIVITPIDGS